ncbi:hypothetical protein [Lichenifustis flavocetrariae]|uniref:Uncharacterized protein n=1 Tax=Lichenifustis flavocetrariae TaxID=2949735 RepID=A0AA41Z480_9HYPH|nr:hypothetical protein [Lichenifustis flavocetrariae]MCW6508937.1 hypothetical protein [Lichenifustis flavocetrariae]
MNLAAAAATKSRTEAIAATHRAGMHDHDSVIAMLMASVVGYDGSYEP